MVTDQPTHRVLFRKRQPQPDSAHTLTSERIHTIQDFHRKLPGYAPTPTVQSDALAAALGVKTVSIKVENARFGLPAFKMLGASWATYQALCERLGFEPEWRNVDDLRNALQPLGALTLAAATDGNHGRAVARTAKWFGLGAKIYVPHDMAEARMNAIRSEGAEVMIVNGSYDDAVNMTAALTDPQTLVISDTSWEGYERIPAWVIEGYSTMLAEVEADLQAKALGSPECIAVQAGVGALAASVMGYFGGQNAATFVCVEPITADCVYQSLDQGEMAFVPGPHTSIMAGLNCGVASRLAMPVLAAYVDAAVGISDHYARDAVYDLWHRCGVEAGESGAAGLAGLYALLKTTDAEKAREYLHITPSSHILVLVTEGATHRAAFEATINAPRA